MHYRSRVTNADASTRDAPTLYRQAFRRSTRCSLGSCVEVAQRADGHVVIRDSKNLTHPAMAFSEEEWRAFVLGVKGGEFDFDLAGL